ncbi:MAG: phosphoribosylglycinamide formyltransferase [Xanthomonadales bacterium]|nr:phosphoribosylglycinamide formyltransferase [Xanthomonadales bacterium]NNL96189.1 phosphoribosylglycinamide formyltransferase [Xanthomonadales bacterium]
MNTGPLRTAVLISGTGSNLKTLIEASNRGRLNLDLCQVISSRADAPGLEHARTAGIPAEVISESDGGLQDQKITACLRPHDPELVVLAGYMRILGRQPVEAFSGRMINLHPSLLPLFPGLDTYRRVLEAGNPMHGASIHFVTSELDAGPVIAQVQVPVRENDTPGDLAARVGPREHALLTATVELFARRRVEMSHEQVLLDGQPISQPLQLNEANVFA